MNQDVDAAPLERRVRRFVAAEGLDDTKTKYPCYNSEKCSATWTWDCWHCCGCKNQGLQIGDLTPNFVLCVNLTHNTVK